MLLLNTSADAGGAAIAARRILAALNKYGEPSVMLVRDGRPATSAEAEREGAAHIRFYPRRLYAKALSYLERLLVFMQLRSRKNLFAVDIARLGLDVTVLPEFKEARAVHLHWVNQGFLSFAGLKKIVLSGKPIVWTLHDMWPLTGVCHQAGACDGWRTDACRRCNFVPRIGQLAARTYAKKAELLSMARPGQITFVGCSRWLAECAAASPLTRLQRVATIPNPIDTAFYAPAESRAEALAELGLPVGAAGDENAPVYLLFTAFNLLDDGKGHAELAEALRIFRKANPALANRLVLLAAGKNGDRLAAELPVRVKDLGYVDSPRVMRAAYRAARFMLMPTRADNLPNTIVESMACGTPVIATAVGGIPQMITDGVTGFLTPPRDAAAFAAAMAKALAANHTPLARNARTAAVGAYSQEAVAKAYIRLLET